MQQSVALVLTAIGMKIPYKCATDLLLLKKESCIIEIMVFIKISSSEI